MNFIKFIQKYSQFYILYTLKILIMISLMFLEGRNQLWVLIPFICWISIFISSLTILYIYGDIAIGYYEICLNSLFYVQIIETCFMSVDLFKINCLLLKITELEIILTYSKKASIIILFLFNVPIVIALSMNPYNVHFYNVISFSTLIIYYVKFKKETIQQQEYVEEMVRSRQKSNILSYVDQSVTKIWYQRLEQIPVGIMIIRQDNNSLTYKNTTLYKLFDHREDLEKYLLDKLEFSIVDKEKLTKDPMRQFHSQLNNNLTQYNFIVNSEQSLYTLRQILAEFATGGLQEYRQNNYIELETQIFQKGCTEVEDDQTKQITCKICRYRDQSETVLIFDDITVQTNIKKIEARQKFSSKLIDSFSHELRTPLNSAQIFLQAVLNDPILQAEDLLNCSFESYKIKEKSLNYKVKQTFNSCIIPALNSLKLQEYLIRDIIDFTQFHLKQIRYEFKTFTLEDILEEISTMFTGLFQRKGLGLQIYIKNTFNTSIYSDYYKIMQILINCMQNAHKFSEQGTVKIEIQGNSKYIQFSIEDQGIGLEGLELKSMQTFLSSFIQNQNINTSGEWKGIGLLISQLNLLKLSPINHQQFEIYSAGKFQGTKVTFKITKDQNNHSQVQLSRQVLTRQAVHSNTVPPEEGNSLQGAIILSQPRQRAVGSRRISIKLKSSISDHFIEQPEMKIKSNQSLEEADILSQGISLRYSIDSERINIINKIQDLQNQNDFEGYSLMEQLNSPSNLDRRKIIYSSQSLQSPQMKGLISRLGSKEQEQNKKENLKFGCRCNRVLSVDDDTFNQQALQIILHQMGFNCETAFNGQQAIQLIENHRKCSNSCTIYYFILMDCQMPIMDGWQTTKYLAQRMKQKLLPFIPIFGLTAFTSKADVEYCIQSGMQEVLAKPLKISELKNLLINKFS